MRRIAPALLALLLLGCGRAAPAGQPVTPPPPLPPMPAQSLATLPEPPPCTQHKADALPVEGIAYGAGTYVAVGRGGRILRSADGARWTAVPSGTPCHLYAVAFGGGTFLAVGEDGATLTSGDGAAWKWQEGPPGRFDLKQVTWGDGAFLLTGPAHMNFRSRDGENWEILPLPGNGFSAIAWTGDRFLGAVWDGPLLSSRDGEHWRQLHPRPPAGATVAIACGGGHCVAATWGGLLRSGDGGESWREIAIKVSGRALAYGGGRFTLLTEQGTLLWSADGERWAPAGRETPAPLTAISYGSGLFVAAGRDGLYTSADGQQWRQAQVEEL